MIPLTIGGHSGAALRRAARYGSGWFGINLDPAATRELVERLDGSLQAEGRPPGDLRIIIGSINHPLQPDHIPAYAEVGVDEVLIPYLRQSPRWIESYRDSLQPFLDAAARC